MTEAAEPFVRRPPPAFRRAAVETVERVSPRLVRVTLAGPELRGFPMPEPAGSVRVLLPTPATPFEIPTWTGNEFLRADGTRPVIRTLTPLRLDTAAGRLDIEIVDHGSGAAAGWAAHAEPGAEVAVSGPARGWAVERAGPHVVLGGDETAAPAIGQILEALPPASSVDVHIEIADRDGERPLPDHPGARLHWHLATDTGVPGDALVAAIKGLDLPDRTTLWIAGEAAAVQRIRRYVFDDLDLPRTAATIRGYWKHGRAGEAG